MSFAREIRWTEYEDLTLKIPDKTAHLWNLENSGGVLTPEELTYYRKIKNNEAREGFVQARGGLRRIVSHYMSCPESKVEFRQHEHGKPFVEGAPEFNLSHTKGRAFAVFASQPVGLDVESRSREVHATALADKFFTPAEARRIRAAEAVTRNMLFLRHWVCKEAMVKLSGDGIYHGLRDAEVDFRDGSRGRYRGREVWLWEFFPAPGLLGALASWEPLEVKGFLRT